MHTVTLTYRRFFRTREIHATFPATWSEMTAKQFCTLFSRPDDASLIATMLNIRKQVVRKLSQLQVYELAGLFDFIRKDQKVSAFTLDTIRSRKTGVLYAPRPKLAEMPFAQFIYVDTLYMEYVQKPAADLLREVVAHLYMPASGFDRKAAARTAGRLKGYDAAVLEAIVLNYGLIRQWLVDRYPLVFGGGKKDSDHAKRDASGGSWNDVFENIVGDDLKDRNKYADLPVHVVFRFITKKIKEGRKNAARVR